MGVLFACGWEAGPHEAEGSPGLYPAQATFILQDIWSAEPGASASVIQDADSEGDVGGNGRFAFQPLPEVSTLAIFNGHIFARSGTTVWWSHRVKIVGFQDSEHLETSQYYHIARLGVADAATHPQLALAISIIDATHFVFCVRRSDAEGDWVQTIASSTNKTWPSAHHWVQVELNTSTLALKIYVDDVEEASGTLGAAVGTGGHVLPFSWFDGGKGSSAAVLMIFSDVMSSDSASPLPTTRPPKTYQTILYQADGDVAGFSEWAGSPDNTNKYRNWDDENDLSDKANDKNTPGDADQDQISTWKGIAGTDPVLRSVRALITEYHTVKGREEGGDWQTYTPTTGGGPTYARFSGRQLENAPSGNAWSNARFEGIEAGLRSVDTDLVYEHYLIATGENLERPAKTPAPPAGEPCDLIVVAQVV